MSAPSFFSALARVRQAYAAAPRAVSLHALGRFLSCPMLRVVDRLPPGGRVLDLGAGHGTFALLAVAAGAAGVVAVEPDRRKVLPSYRHPQVAFVAGYGDALSAARSAAFDAVTILDVLYRLPLAGWDPLLTLARDLLAPGGLLLLKEIDPENRFKGAWNRAQEKAADLLGLTLGDAFTYETREQMGARLARLGFEGFAAHDLGAGYPHAHILYVARRSSSASPDPPATRPPVDPPDWASRGPADVSA